MLFNSFEFIYIYMPVVFAGFFLIGRKSHQGAIAWLAAASIFFYSYWSLYALPIMVSSICINYWFGLRLSEPNLRNRQGFLVFAIFANLLALGYFKYANFFIANTNALRDLMGLDSLDSLEVVLPIGISFFTFTQIAFLVDSYQNKVKERSFIQYILFVSFFPHLLAGPLIHHKQMMPQFSDPDNFKINKEKIILGIAIFAVGLAKKVLIADTLSGFVDGFFNSFLQGNEPSFWVCWLGPLAYTFQLYFDFSGYSDMAVGLSLLFGIWLPFNFNSPFRSTSIIDFWQRWHITLTNYVGQYLYTPLTLKFMRLGQDRAAIVETIVSLVIPTLIIFLILGLWHGSNWTYVIYGGMHGFYIVANHVWRKFFPLPNKKNKKAQRFKPLKKFAGWLLTFLAVVVSFVMFRADSVATAADIYRGMLGAYGFHFGTVDDWVNGLGLELLVLVVSFLIIFLMPNSISMVSFSKKAFPGKEKLVIPFSLVCLAAIAGLSYMTLFHASPFLYFQF